MTTVAQLTAKLGLDSREFERDLAGQAEKARGITARAGGFISQAFSFATGGLITRGIDAITGSFGNLTDGMVGGNAAFEGYNKRFKVMLGSVDMAKQRMADLAEFGAKTPFELPQVIEADTVLQGFALHSLEAAQKFGFSGEQIRTIAGDVASGTGADFAEMAGLIGRFSAGATGEAISRMQELGITNRDELAKMGLAFSKSGELVSPLPESMSVVLRLMQQKYGGLMEEQSSTFDGMVSNLMDWKDSTLRIIGEPIFNVLREQLQALLRWLSSPGVQAAIRSFALWLAEKLGTSMNFISTTAIPALRTAWDTLKAPMEAVIGVASRLKDLIGGGGGLSGVVTGLGAGLREGAPLIETWARNLLKGVPGAGLLLDKLSELFDWMASPAAPAAMQSLAGSLRETLGSAFDFLNTNVVPALLDTLGRFTAWLASPDVQAAINNFAAWISGQIGAAADFISTSAIPALLDIAGRFIAWLTSPDVQAAINNFAAWISGQIGAAADFISTSAIPALLDTAKRFITWLGSPEVQQAIRNVASWISDKLGIAMAFVSDTAIPALRDGLDMLRPAFESVVDVVKRVVALFGGEGGAGMGLGTLVESVGGIIKDAVPTISGYLADWALAFLRWVPGAAVGLIGSLGDLLGEFLTWIVVHGPDIQDTLDTWTIQFVTWTVTKGMPALGQALIDLGAGLWDIISEKWIAAWAEGSIGRSLIDGLVNGIADSWGSITGWLGAVGSDFVDAIKGGINDAWDSFADWFIDKIAALVPGGYDTLQRLGFQVPGRALGGPVVAGRAYTVGERGPELFVPGLAGMIVPNGGGGGGGTTIVVNVGGSVIAERDLAETIRTTLLRQKQSRLSLGLS